MSRERTVHRLLIAVVATAAASLAAAQSGQPSVPAERDTPADVVERLHAGLVELAAEAGGTTLEARIERLRPLVTATHDLPYIAEVTIRRTWDDLTDAERERFVAAFERLSIASYASRFADLDGDPFRTIDATAPDTGRAEVNAEIDPPDADPIPLDYVLHETDAGWRIVNIVADGVSDLALKRAEYRRVLTDGTIEDLIAELHSQVDNLR